MANPLNTVGKRLQRLRKDLGMSQQTFLQELKKFNIHMSQSALSRIETDEQEASASFLAAAAQVLGTTADYIVLLSEDSALPDDIDSQTYTRDAHAIYASDVIEIATIASSLSPRRRRELLQHALVMARSQQEEQDELREDLERLDSLINAIEDEGGRQAAEKALDLLAAASGLSMPHRPARLRAPQPGKKSSQ